MSLKVYILPTLKLIFSHCSVEYFSVSNVNSYQCSCKQTCAIAVYANVLLCY